jgi:hypothetical protein
MTNRVVIYALRNPYLHLSDHSRKLRIAVFLVIQWTVQVFTARLTETSVNSPDVVEDVTNQENQDTGKTLKKLIKTKQLC